MRDDNKVPVDKGGSGEVKVIHNVHILDASGSMQGPKYKNAIEGINGDLREMRNNPIEGTTVTNTVIEFSHGGWSGRGIGDGNGTHIHYFMTNASNTPDFVGRGAHGGTHLYQTVGETIEKLLKHINAGDKVLVKIFTDGEENSSSGIYRDPHVLKNLIKQVEDNHNFTVTFMGTKGDIEDMVRNVGINFSNTLSHLNTAASIGATYSMSSQATTRYRGAVARGASQDELKQGFFKDVVVVDNNSQSGVAGIAPLVADGEATKDTETTKKPKKTK